MKKTLAIVGIVAVVDKNGNLVRVIPGDITVNYRNMTKEIKVEQLIKIKI